MSDPGRVYREVMHWWWTALAVYGPALASFTIASVIVVAAVGWWRRQRLRERWAKGARWVHITAPAEVDPAGAERAWSTLHALAHPKLTRLWRGQPHLAFEIHATSNGLSFGLWVPATIAPGHIEHAVRAAWPTAEITTRKKKVPTPLPTPADGRRMVVAAGRLPLARQPVLPLRTEQKLDPLRAVLAPLQHLHENETGCVQILARPVTGGARATAMRRAAHHLATHPTAGGGVGSRSWWGRLTHGALGAAVFGVLRALLDIATPARVTTHRSGQVPGGRARRGPGPRTPYQRDLVAAAGRKTTASVRLWAVQARYATTLTVPDTITDAGWRRAHTACRGRAGALAAGFAVLSGHNYLHRRPLHNLAALQSRWMGSGQLWSTDELAAIAHLPLDTRVAGLTRAGATAVAPPPNIATPHSRANRAPFTAEPAKQTDDQDVVVLGDSNAGRKRPVGLSISDRSRHVCLLGITGTGKSTCLSQLVLADAAAGRAAVLIDPKTDTVPDIVARLSPDATERLVLLDPDADGPVPVLNLLDPNDPIAVDNLISIVAHVYRASWGDRIAEGFRIGCLTAISHYRQLAARNATTALPHLGDVMDLFTRDSARYRATEHLHTSTDPTERQLADYWHSYEARTPAGREETARPLLNKLRGLLLRPFTRSVLCGTGPAINMTRILDHGGLCLARLPEGVLGSDTTRLLGSLVVAKVWQATTARARQPEHTRQPAALYLEEAPQFLTMHTPIDTILAQARGYQLALILALQNLAQTGTRELREAISANVLHKIYFRLGAEDATYAERHTKPDLTAYDLAHLDDYTAAVRLHPHGKDTPAFTMRTRPLPPRSRTV